MKEKKYDIIINIAYKLFSEKGYFFVTTKEIAETAQISEMTIFRNFGTKKNLFLKIIDRYVFSPTYKRLFENEISYNLKEDLLKIFNVFSVIMKQNHKLIWVNTIANPKLDCNDEIPQLIDNFLKEIFSWVRKYFLIMKEKNKISADPILVSISFFSYIHGYFFTNKMINLYKDSGYIENEQNISSFIDIFINGISQKRQEDK
jgi:TetR/AcrR family transcriptional regulator, mexJK operon transcriptional repressor